MSRGSSFHSVLIYTCSQPFLSSGSSCIATISCIILAFSWDKKPWGTAVSTIVYTRQAFVLVYWEQSIFKPSAWWLVVMPSFTIKCSCLDAQFLVIMMQAFSYITGSTHCSFFPTLTKPQGTNISQKAHCGLLESSLPVISYAPMATILFYQQPLSIRLIKLYVFISSLQKKNNAFLSSRRWMAMIQETMGVS